MQSIAGVRIPEHRRRKRTGGLLTAAFVGATALTGSAWAAEINTGTGVKIRFDNTVKYSTAFRVKSPSETLLSNPNLDDGDRNFKRGLISNRVDLLSEFDIRYQDFGARLSAAAWYDTVYNHGTDNPAGAPTANAASVPSDAFTQATRDLHGRKAEILDAFVYGKTYIDDMSLSGRVGRHALLYGESLFFGANGIAAAQSPIDVIKAQSVPNTQFKELLRPVNQVSGQLQINDNLAIGGYYQFEWTPHRLPGSGSYFSVSDTVDSGASAERIIAGPGVYFYRGQDYKARNNGQGGVKLRWRPEDLNTDFGFYAANYHDKFFQYYIQPGVGAGAPANNIGKFALAYGEDIQVYGTSFSTTVGSANVAGEISVRHNMPLTTPPIVVDSLADNKSHVRYAVGDTLHANLSVIDIYAANALWDFATLVGEIAWNRRMTVTENQSALDPAATRDAMAMRVVFEPSYYQVVDGLDISVPIGVGYNPYGRSSVVQGFGAEHGGDISIGVNGEYLKTWKGSLSFTHYFGAEAPVLNTAGTYTYKQSLRDRDFVAFSLSRTF